MHYNYSRDRHSCTTGVYRNVDYSAHRGSHHRFENVPCWTVWTNAWPKVREIFWTPPPHLQELSLLLHTCSPTFKPVEQEQESSKMYNGPGFLPCNGWATSSGLKYTPTPTPLNPDPCPILLAPSKHCILWTFNNFSCFFSFVIWLDISQKSLFMEAIFRLRVMSCS